MAIDFNSDPDRRFLNPDPGLSIKKEYADLRKIAQHHRIYCSSIWFCTSVRKGARARAVLNRVADPDISVGSGYYFY